MKTSILSIIILFVFVSLVDSATAQKRLIKGVVTTFDSIALIGADVKVKSSKEIVKTDTLGEFEVMVQPKDKISISAKGFQKVNVKIEEKIKIVAVNLKLKPTEKAKEYAIGYGYVKDADRLNALAQLNSDDVDFSQYSNMYDLIRGRFAGVQVSNSGEIMIRGISSINLTNAALIIIDGMQADNSVMNSLPPSQVKSINIIKDGGAAIYGARGANGVVIIETKKGNE
ncbi:MAG TPA: TonB-dependent receptor plug domain-containing protein [Draconibacterium sp.]|nr:TonB-dependent receptor plug domain-containing protein [Draconibacterium sp.]